jgi:hypothetical protein
MPEKIKDECGKRKALPEGGMRRWKDESPAIIHLDSLSHFVLPPSSFI